MNSRRTKILLDYDGIREDARKIGMLLMGATLIAHFINESAGLNWTVLITSVIVWTAGVIKLERPATEKGAK